MLEVDDAEVVLARLAVIGLTEEVGQHEMAVGPTEQSLAAGLLQLLGRGAALFVDGLQGQVCRGDGGIG